MVEGTRLESVRTFTRTAGSNPALSARQILNRTHKSGLGFFLCNLVVFLIYIEIFCILTGLFGCICDIPRVRTERGESMPKRQRFELSALSFFALIIQPVLS